jgi:hypothetical protein
MTSLFKISEQHAQALAIIEQMFDDGCSEEELNEALCLLDGVESDFNAKAVNVDMYIRNLQAEENAINEAKKAMDAREKAIKNKRESLTAYLLNQMLLTNTKQVKCPYFIVSTRTNAPSVKVDSNVNLPETLLLPPKPREPDKKAIKEMLEQGMVIDGCRLERSQSLSIK